MSKKNSPEAKQAARQRLRAERERQARRAAIRRRAVVGGTVLAVLGITAGIGVAMAGRDGGGGDNTDWGAVRAQLDGDTPEDTPDGGERTRAFPTAAPAHARGENGLTIRLGDEDAEHTLTLYEDPRCPACAAFEQSMGRDVRQGLRDGSYQVEWVFGTFIDDMAGGTGSKNALAALGAALDVSPEAFLGYHEALYAAEHHPAEANDAYADDQRLIEIARQVPELRNNQRFQVAVNDSAFAVWALRMSDRFDRARDVDSTPTLSWDGRIVATPRSPEQFEAMVDQITG